MDFAKHQELFSAFRMLKYNKAAGGVTDMATAMYLANIQVSQALYPLISILEISLRNVLDKQMRIEFKSNDWIQDQERRFLNHHELTYVDRKGRIQSDTLFTDKVYGAKQKLAMVGGATNHNNLVAELGIHFWIKFFDEKPIKLLKGIQLMVFKNAPRIKNKELYTLLMGVKLLRNRISHHEPICFDSGGNFCMKYAIQKYYHVIEVLRWIDDDLVELAVSFNCLASIQQAIRIYTVLPPHLLTAN